MCGACDISAANKCDSNDSENITLNERSWSIQNSSPWRWKSYRHVVETIINQMCGACDKYQLQITVIQIIVKT